MRWVVFAFTMACPATALAADYYVTPTGDDTAAGSKAAPWKTLQHASDTIAAGDTVHVAAGSYTGFDVRTSGTSTSPIVFMADSGTTIDQDNDKTPDGINLEGVSYVTVDGFTCNGRTRAGIRSAVSDHVTIRNCHADKNGVWGILTGHVSDSLIELNECSNSVQQHGIYVGNEHKRTTVRKNKIWGNAGCGIHMNGDLSQGAPGIIQNDVIDSNIIYDNGKLGGSGINCDGVQDSLFQNNLVYTEHASGMSLYYGDSAEGSKRDVVVNNTIIVAGDGRWALNIQNASTDNTAYNNILLDLNAGHGSVAISQDSVPGFVSDYNVLADAFTINDAANINLAAWQAATGQDKHSFTSTSAALFVDATADDYHLSATSPAIDKGTSMKAPSVDLDGHARPVGLGFDIGACEYCAGSSCVDAGGTDAGGPAGDGGVPPGQDAGSVSDGGASQQTAGADGGCSCREGAQGSGATGTALGALALAFWLVRRRQLLRP